MNEYANFRNRQYNQAVQRLQEASQELKESEVDLRRGHGSIADVEAAGQIAEEARIWVAAERRLWEKANAAAAP